VPAVVDSGDSSAVTVGVEFESSVAGYVDGVEFYKASTNTGTHVGALWSSSGTLLTSATFTGETASGWQQVTFPSPVAVAANTVYMASYSDPNGHYSYTTGTFNSAVSNPPLTGVANSGSTPNGAYVYSSTSTFPTSSYNAASYGVDVVFSTTTTGVPAVDPTYGVTV